MAILIELASRTDNFTAPDPYNSSNFIIVPLITESADINIEETWPAAYANYKKISYQGPNIRTKEIYENNGDIVTSSIDSWKLDKESLYQTALNRTYISARVTPTLVAEDRAMNKSSFYALRMDSTGSLTHLGFARRQLGFKTQSKGVQRNPDVFVSEDYVGQQSITLKVNMGDFVYRNRDDDEWLPCSCGSVLDEIIAQPDYFKGSKGFGYNVRPIFDCTCPKVMTQAQFPRVYK